MSCNKTLEIGETLEVSYDNGLQKVFFSGDYCFARFLSLFSSIVGGAWLTDCQNELLSSGGN